MRYDAQTEKTNTVEGRVVSSAFTNKPNYMKTRICNSRFCSQSLHCLSPSFLPSCVVFTKYAPHPRGNLSVEDGVCALVEDVEAKFL